MMFKLSAVFFDLDGTLADTAADLYAALCQLCSEEQQTPPPFADFRRIVSQGSPAMLEMGFQIGPKDTIYEELRDRLLTYYHQDIASHTSLFPETDEVLTALAAAGIQWGIVTNKPGWLTDALMKEMGFGADAVCVISGDTLVRRKPDPDQLMMACEAAQCTPRDAVYVGDARSDVVAGKAAGVRTAAASFGYIPPHEDPNSWGADRVIASPLELLDWLGVSPAGQP